MTIRRYAPIFITFQGDEDEDEDEMSGDECTFLDEYEIFKKFPGL
jgi:hypothetical protein